MILFDLLQVVGLLLKIASDLVQRVSPIGGVRPRRQVAAFASTDSKTLGLVTQSGVDLTNAGHGSVTWGNRPPSRRPRNRGFVASPTLIQGRFRELSCE